MWGVRTNPAPSAHPFPTGFLQGRVRQWSRLAGRSPTAEMGEVREGLAFAVPKFRSSARWPRSACPSPSLSGCIESMPEILLRGSPAAPAKLPIRRRGDQPLLAHCRSQHLRSWSYHGTAQTGSRSTSIRAVDPISPPSTPDCNSCRCRRARRGLPVR